MPVTQEYRTIMYSVRKTKEGEQEVIVHKLPFDANQTEGGQKLQKYLRRGFTFNDPRGPKGLIFPEVIVTDEVNLEKPEQVEDEPEVEENTFALQGQIDEFDYTVRELKQKPEVPAWGYFCTKCEKIHNNNSRIGKRDMKHKEAE